MREYLVAICKFRQEFAVSDMLREWGENVDVFCPVYRAKVRPRGRHSTAEVEVVRPLYGRYIFVGMERDVEDESGRTMWKKIFSVHGVATIIMHDYMPVWISAGQIDAIRGLDWDRIMIENSEDYIAAGDDVEVRVGPFAMLRGKYLGKLKGKDMVQLTWLGSLHDVSIPRMLLKKIILTEGT